VTAGTQPPHLFHKESNRASISFLRNKSIVYGSVWGWSKISADTTPREPWSILHYDPVRLLMVMKTYIRPQNVGGWALMKSDLTA